MTNNQTAETARSKENTEWIQKIEHLRAYLEQEQDITKSIYERYQTAQAELAKMIEQGNQECIDLKTRYLGTIQDLHQQMRELQYQTGQEIEKIQQELRNY